MDLASSGHNMEMYLFEYQCWKSSCAKSLCKLAHVLSYFCFLTHLVVYTRQHVSMLHSDDGNVTSGILLTFQR